MTTERTPRGSALVDRELRDAVVGPPQVFGIRALLPAQGSHTHAAESGPPQHRTDADEQYDSQPNNEPTH